MLFKMVLSFIIWLILKPQNKIRNVMVVGKIAVKAKAGWNRMLTKPNKAWYSKKDIRIIKICPFLNQSLLIVVLLSAVPLDSRGSIL